MKAGNSACTPPPSPSRRHRPLAPSLLLALSFLPLVGLFCVDTLSSSSPSSFASSVGDFGWRFLAGLLLLNDDNERNNRRQQSTSAGESSGEGRMEAKGTMDSIREDDHHVKFQPGSDDEDDEHVVQKFARKMGLHHENMKHNGRDRPQARPSASQPLPASYNGRNSLFLFSNSQSIPDCFSTDKSTQENYGVDNKEFYGPFREVRAGLDYDYHGNYSRGRQEFQDRIIEKALDGATVRDSTNGAVCRAPNEPWIVFTAGVMGAGKSHTMKQLASRGLFPLQSYVIVDPDEIRSHFPEYHLYASECPKRAGELTHREAGYVTEIVTAVALHKGYNVLVDGSLKDHEWYHEYFANLRREYPVLRIAILHITAPREAVFERARHRARDTGRVVPVETLEESLRQVPVSVGILAPDADYFCELDNSPTSGEATLRTEGVTWDSFRDNWAQTCPWVPPGRRGKM